MNEVICNAAARSSEMLDAALQTLAGIIEDGGQSAASRVTACKVVLDFSLRLDAYVKHLDQEASSLRKLDDIVNSVRDLADRAGEDEGEW